MLFPKSPYRFNTSQVYSISNMVKHGLNGNGETNLHNKLVVQRKNKKVSFKSYFIPSFFVTFLLFSITLPSTKAEDYPDYEFNQQGMNEHPKKISIKNLASNKNFHKSNQAKSNNEKYNYNPNNKNPRNNNNNNNNEDDRDDDIIVTKPVSCFEPSGSRAPNCDYMADQEDQKENLIHPSMRIEKRQSSDDYEDEGEEEEEETNSGYVEKDNDDDEDDEDDDDDDEEEEEDEDDEGKERVIDGRFREEDGEHAYGRTTNRMQGASNPLQLSSNNHNPYNNIKQQHIMRRMSTVSHHAQASQPPYLNYNHQPNYARTNHDVSSSYNKDRQYQQLTAKMNILLIAGIAAGIVVLLFILVLAACKFYTSSTGVAGAKALNDYQRTASKTAYAYEACNTGAKCSSPLLVPTSQQSLTPLNANSQAGLTNVGSSATNTATKPAKKDVKEWYV